MNKKLVFVVLAAIVILALGSFGVAYAKANTLRNTKAPACGYQNCPNGGAFDGSTCAAKTDGTCDGNGACGVNAGQGNGACNGAGQGNGNCGFGQGNGQGNGNGCGNGNGNGNGCGNGAGACSMSAN